MKSEERKEARALRKKGLSIRDIALKVGCSKGSISKWVRDIELTDAQIANLNSNRTKGAAKAAQHPNSLKAKWERKRSAAQKKGQKELLKSPDLLLVAGAALYWGEGAKERGHARFFNSDPRMVRLMVKFFTESCGVAKERLRCQVQVARPDLVDGAEEFWQSETGLPKDQFYKTSVAKSKMAKHNKDSLPFGTFRVGVADTLLRARIEGWVEGLVELLGD